MVPVCPRQSLLITEATTTIPALGHWVPTLVVILTLLWSFPAYILTSIRLMVRWVYRVSVTLVASREVIWWQWLSLLIRRLTPLWGTCRLLMTKMSATLPFFPVGLYIVGSGVGFVFLRRCLFVLFGVGRWQVFCLVQRWGSWGVGCCP